MSVQFLTIPQKSLLKSISSSSSSFKLANIKSWKVNALGQKIDLSASDFGTQAFGCFRNDTGTLLEVFEFDPSTIADTNITILKRGLDFNGDPTTETTAYKLDWPAGTIVQLGTDIPQIFQYLKQYIDDAIIAGAAPASTTVAGIVAEASLSEIQAGTATKTISSVVYKLFAPLDKLKTYITTLFASETVAGIVEEATSAEITAGTATGSTGAKLFVAPDKLISNYPAAGIISPYAGSSAPTGWLLCDGSAVSRTTYARLFAVTSTTYGVGNGTTTFNLPDLRARTPIGIGAVTKFATFASRSGNVITVTGLTNEANNEFQTGQAVLYSAPSGAMTGLTHNTTYYLVRTGNLTFSLATSLANAQNGTVITLSSDGTGTQTFTLTLTTRSLGATGGEENHAMSSTELLAHTHTDTGWQDNPGQGIGYTGNYQQISTTTSSKGGNKAMNNMQPFLGVNYIIKY